LVKFWVEVLDFTALLFLLDVVEGVGDVLFWFFLFEAFIRFLRFLLGSLSTSWPLHIFQFIWILNQLLEKWILHHHLHLLIQRLILLHHTRWLNHLHCKLPHNVVHLLIGLLWQNENR
jgi:hypothetical protein